jgi:hypothetical protein
MLTFNVPGVRDVRVFEMPQLLHEKHEAVNG